jgi:pimeloyl-ACP methyl ester carboxylesterase
VSAKTIGSPGFAFDEATVRANSKRDAERSYYPVGFLRQYAAVMASPERRGKLAKVTAPTVVIHGEADPLVPVTGGRDTAANIPGAELRIIPGMGHDIPPALYDTIVEGVMSAVARSKQKVSA